MSIVRPNVHTCTPSGPWLHFDGQCEAEMDLITRIQSIPIPLDHISEVLHPKYAIILGVGLACYVGGRENQLHYYVIASWLLCDTSHFFLKWMFAGDRPYWVAGNKFQQFAHTCEAGHGFPSGHSCVLASILGAFYWRCVRPLAPKTHRAYGAILVAGELLMMLSRSFTASHFVSQTIVGSLYGLLFVPLSKPFGDHMIFAAKNRHKFTLKDNIMHILWAFSIPALFALLQYVVRELLYAQLFQRDVYRSVQLGREGCYDPAKLKVGTVYQGPLYEIIGVALFLALSLGNTTLRRPLFGKGGEPVGEGNESLEEIGDVSAVEKSTSAARFSWFPSFSFAKKATSDSGRSTASSSTTASSGSNSSAALKKRARNATPVPRKDDAGAADKMKAIRKSTSPKQSRNKSPASSSPGKNKKTSPMKKRASEEGADESADAAAEQTSKSATSSAMKKETAETATSTGAAKGKKTSSTTAEVTKNVATLELSPTEIIYDSLDEVKYLPPILCKMLIYVTLVLAFRRVLDYDGLFVFPDWFKRLSFAYVAFRLV
ncbi:unnamed protein product [Amoebophrya sp. A120]|nr:unnamed protein product [Amoebophrya sp. A120]|eukprot:GSA120T00002873001.1